MMKTRDVVGIDVLSKVKTQQEFETFKVQGLNPQKHVGCLLFVFTKKKQKQKQKKTPMMSVVFLLKKALLVSCCFRRFGI